MEAAARSAFWGLDINMLKRVAAHLQIDISDSHTLLDVLTTMIAACLHIEENDAMVHAAQRLNGWEAQDPESMDIIGNLDEAAACVSRDDEKYLKSTQASAKERRSDLLAFQQAYREKASTLRANTGKKTKVRKVAKKSMPDDMDGLEQRDVKVFFPSTSKVWKSRSDGTWRCQVATWPKELSRSTRKYGYSGAIKLLATEAWYCWHILTGEDWASVPVDGLLSLDDLFAELPAVT